jgi:hypothetical protein
LLQQLQRVLGVVGGELEVALRSCSSCSSYELLQQVQQLRGVQQMMQQ